MALSVPLSRFTPRVGGGSVFFVRHHHTHDTFMTKALLGSLSLLASLIFGWSAFRVFIGCFLPWRKAPDTTHTTLVIIAGMQFSGWQLLVPLAVFVIIASAFLILGLWILKRQA